MALAKQQEELYLPHAPAPLRLPLSSPALTLCRRLRDEAHASALLSHRILRHSHPFASVLDGAPGLSLGAKARLRAAFGGSAASLRQATEEDLFTALRDGTFTAPEGAAAAGRDGASGEGAHVGEGAVKDGGAAQGRVGVDLEGSGEIVGEGRGDILVETRGDASHTSGHSDAAGGGRADAGAGVSAVDPVRLLAAELAAHLRRLPPPPPRLNLTLTLDGYDSAAAAVGAAAGRRAGAKVTAQAAEAAAGRWWRQRRAQRLAWLREQPGAPLQLLRAVAAVIHDAQALPTRNLARAQLAKSRQELLPKPRLWTGAESALAAGSSERVDLALARGRAGTLRPSQQPPAAADPVPQRYQALDPPQPRYEALARLEAALGAWGPPAPDHPTASEHALAGGDDPLRSRRAADGAPAQRYDTLEPPMVVDGVGASAAPPARRLQSIASSGLAFQLEAPYAPSGDQPAAIAGLVSALRAGAPRLQLKGATGTGKTFVMASVVAQMNVPTLVLAPNKVLAAQLCGELRAFFPNNAVTYFVSHFDHYRPEAYKASTRGGGGGG